MSIYAISDLHLSFNTNKPMDIFGWENYEERIKKNWLEKVNEKDLVLLPGDFSWEMKLENTYKDFEFINNLPGKKLLLKGNHDLWWTTLKKMRTFLEEENLKERELLRLENSIKNGIEKYGKDKPIIVCMHYPPLLKDFKNSEFTKILEKYNTKYCIYGHLHGKSHVNVLEGNINGVNYKMASCDYTKFDLIKIV